MANVAAARDSPAEAWDEATTRTKAYGQEEHHSFETFRDGYRVENRKGQGLATQVEYLHVQVVSPVSGETGWRAPRIRLVPNERGVAARELSQLSSARVSVQLVAEPTQSRRVPVLGECVPR